MATRDTAQTGTGFYRLPNSEPVPVPMEPIVPSLQVYLDLCSSLIGTKANTPVVLNTPSALSSSQIMEPPAPTTPSCVPSPPPAAEPIPDEPSIEKSVQKPSQWIVDLLEGHGCTSNHPSDSVITPGIQALTIVAEKQNCVLEEKGQSNWMMWTDFVMNLVEEYAMAAEIREAEALEPQTLAEVKCCPDWPLWVDNSMDMSHP